MFMVPYPEFSDHRSMSLQTHITLSREVLCCGLVIFKFFSVELYLLSCHIFLPFDLCDRNVFITT